MGTDERKTFVLDTNILLHEPQSIFSFQEHNVIIPMTVLEELDRIKDSKRDVSREARIAIRMLESVFLDATAEEIAAGVPLSKHGAQASGCIAIFADYGLDETAFAFPHKEGDSRILNGVLYLQKQRAPQPIILVTKDINMRLRAKGAGVLRVEDYRTDQLIDDVRFLTKGFRHLPGNFWNKVEVCQTQHEGRETYHSVDASL
ncbi:MAG: PIN domain-containing protein, partial [Plesiomonas sp.]